MTLIEKIENLQKKPEPHKRKILFASVFFLMSLIVSLWLLSLNFFESDKKSFSKEDFTPFMVIKNDIRDAKDKLSSSAIQIKNLFNGFNGHQ